MEVLYWTEKHRIPINLQETLGYIESSNKYIKVAESIQFYELHNRLILATAKWLNIPIVSSDSLFP